MINKAPFVVYNASAGSGKTYSLVKSYLSKILSSNQPDVYKQILAITFTNKAVAEMKSRILSILINFANGEFRGQTAAISASLVSEIGISQEDIQKRASIVLRHLINNYALFSIETIDHFNHRLLRTFARDLKLNSNFEVSIDTSLLLAEAVDRLIDKAGQDPEITALLVQYALQKTDDDKSWDIAVDLKKAAELLTKENDLLALEKLRNKPLTDFEALASHIQKAKGPKEELIRQTAKNLLTLFASKGLQSNHFDRGYLYKYFLKIADGDTGPKFDAAWQKKLGVADIHSTKHATDAEISIINALVPKIIDALDLIKESYYDIKLGENILKNLVPLATVHLVDQEFQQLKEEGNIVPISDFNSLIHNEIKHQPAPFIYERLGERYKHYFIDEFQDTSKLQWENLIPLLENALSQSDALNPHGSLLIVGDAKQSIYRWRGGLPEQFMGLYGSENPFPFVEKQTENLDTNFRSCQEIVRFNNHFFSFISNYFGDEKHLELYKVGNCQKPFLTCAGYVQLDFLAPATKEENNVNYVAKSFEIITELRERGYPLSDICILVRKKDQGTLISEFLAEKSVPVISEETLLLKNSEKVKALLHLLHLQLFPENDEVKMELCLFLHPFLSIDENLYVFLSGQIRQPLSTLSRFLKGYNISINFEVAKSLGLYQSLEYLIQALGLSSANDAYLTHFMDWVFQVSKGPNSGKWEFLDYWELKKDRLSLSASSGANAVSVMTIHKSKGLEFPVVIFPFAEQDIYFEKEAKVWFPFNVMGFEELSINMNKEVENYGQTGSALYHERQNTLELDSLNLLYVALTRAQKELFIISKSDKEKDLPKSYNDFFKLYLQKNALWTEEQSTYFFGERTTPENGQDKFSDELGFAYIVSQPESHQIKMVSASMFNHKGVNKNALDFGTLFHDFMAQIKTADDIAGALAFFSENFSLSMDMIENLQNRASQVFQNEHLKGLFTGNDNVRNEENIITPNGVVRPDRLNFHQDGSLTILDYKTGRPQEEHVSQITGYSKVLEEMGYAIKQKLIVYMEDQEIIVNKL